MGNDGITALAPWFGAKRAMASKIVSVLEHHTLYVEPFCGSMAVLLNKPQARVEIVNDLHGDLVNLARVIRHPTDGPWLYRRLRRTWVHQDLFEESKDRLKAAECPEGIDRKRAYDFFLVSWMGRSGVAGTGIFNAQFTTRYTPEGGSQAHRFVGAVRSIPQFRRRLERVTICRMDAFKLLAKIADRKGVAIYCDPPYLLKGAKYVHDFTAWQHAELAAILDGFKRARVVVSYYDAPRLDDFYPAPKWTKVDCTMTKAMSLQGRRDSTKEDAPEVLLVNGPVQGELF